MIGANAPDGVRLFLCQRAFYSQSEELGVARNRVEWSTQLVTHHCQKLRLGAICLRYKRVRSMQFFFRSLSLGSRSAQHQERCGSHAHEILEREQTPVQCRLNERAMTRCRSPHCDRGNDKSGRDRSTLPKPDRSPNHNGEKHISLSECGVARCGRHDKNEKTRNKNRHRKCGGFGHPFRPQQWTTCRCPDEDGRRHQERADRITKPPCTPSLDDAPARDESTELQTRDSDGCAHNGRERTGENDEREGVPQAAER